MFLCFANKIQHSTGKIINSYFEYANLFSNTFVQDKNFSLFININTLHQMGMFKTRKNGIRDYNTQSSLMRPF